MTFLDQDNFNQPGSGIMDPVEHSIVEEGWGEVFTRQDAPQLLGQIQERLGCMSITELIKNGPK